MRWILLAALAYACLVLETAVFRPGALAVEVDGHWARPDLVLTVGLFLALFFEPAEVFIAGWCLGLASDLVTVTGRLGLKALLFCLVLTGISAVRTEFPRTRVWGHFAMALLLVFVVHLAWYVTTRLVGGAGLWLGRSAEESFLDALYSAVLAPYLFWGLLLLREPLRIAVPSHEG
jgi:rod shape-determining protein MreD